MADSSIRQLLFDKTVENVMGMIWSVATTFFSVSFSAKITASFVLAVFENIFKKFYYSRVFRIYIEIFLKNILKYLRVVEFLKYILEYF